MASRPFQFREKKHFKIGKSAAKHFEGLAALSIHSAERRARSRPGVNPFISVLTVARCPAIFPRVWPQLRDTLSTSQSVGRRTGRSYTPCLLSKTDLRLRLHATQAQHCFPAASNALALPGGNGIFTATPTERITHYTLLRKVVCQMGALPPLETPTRKGGTLPLHGAHTAFSCYPALRLYRLSKSQRGIDVVSLTK